MSPQIKNLDPRAWLQEIKSSRKLQAALAGLPIMLWLLWPSSPKGPARLGPRVAPAALGERQTQELKQLPELAILDKAGELPLDAHLYRDLFLFEGPPPPPLPPGPAPPPPPPPTPEQLAAESLRQAREQQFGSRPQGLRYLGYLGSASSGRLGAFMKGDDPLSIRLGALANPGWRLVKLSEATAEFQNLAFPDLRCRLDALEPQPGRSSARANEF